VLVKNRTNQSFSPFSLFVKILFGFSLKLRLRFLLQLTLPMSFCFRARRIDIKNPAHEFLAVKSAYRSERLLLIRHLDKTKPS
jgi:hypothetical protein